MNWPVRESARFALEQDGETGADAVEALTTATCHALRDAAPLLDAADPRNLGAASLGLLLALRCWGDVGAAIGTVLDQPEAAQAEWGADNFLRTLAFALWRGKVAEEVTTLRTKPPAWSASVQQSLVRTFLNPTLHAVPDATGRSLELLDEDGRCLARAPTLPVHTAAALARRPNALVTMNGQRALRYLATKGHLQALRSEPGARVLRFVGGWEACAREAGLREGGGNGKAVEELKLILDAGRYFEGWGPKGMAGGLWTYEHQYASGGRKGEAGRPGLLLVTLSTALVPDGIFQLDNRWLQPITPMPPRFGTYAREWPKQAGFETELIGLLLDHREELVDEGAARLRLSDLEGAAARVGLERQRVAPLMEYWSAAPDDGAQLLERVGRGRWHLADNETYRTAREYLTAAGRRTKAARKAGRKASQRRRH